MPYVESHESHSRSINKRAFGHITPDLTLLTPNPISLCDMTKHSAPCLKSQWLMGIRGKSMAEG